MKQTCQTCLAEYDNGTSGLHGCDPLALLKQFKEAFGKLSVEDVDRMQRVMRNEDVAIDLLDVYMRVRRLLADIEEAEPANPNASVPGEKP